MNVLVTGSSGMLGATVVKFFIEKGFNVYGISRTRNPQLDATHEFSGDLTDGQFLQSVSLTFQPDVIVHTAALVDLKFCEQNPMLAKQLHVDATHQLVTLFTKARFIYISTDSVFDGQRGDYSELDQPNPLNHYSKTKLEGEQVVSANAPSYAIIRTNLFGFHNPMKNSLFEWAYTSLSNGQAITGFANVFFNPLYCFQLAEIIHKISARKINGVFHVGSTDVISKYDFLLAVAKQFSLKSDLIGKSQLDPIALGAMRPLNTTLNTKKVESFGIEMPGMKINLNSLHQFFIKTFQKHDTRV